MKVIFEFTIVNLILFLSKGVVAVRWLEDEPSVCDDQTAQIRADPQYQAAVELIEKGLEEIDSDCEINGSYEFCIGAINSTYIEDFTQTCEGLGGQVIELETVKINCKPSSYYNYTEIELIPECVGLNCTESEIGDTTDEYMDELLEANLAWAGKGRCTVDEGGTPHSGVYSHVGLAVLKVVLLLSSVVLFYS